METQRHNFLDSPLGQSLRIPEPPPRPEIPEGPPIPEPPPRPEIPEGPPIPEPPPRPEIPEYPTEPEIPEAPPDEDEDNGS